MVVWKATYSPNNGNIPMSFCGLRSRETTRLGLGATAVALIFYQIDSLTVVTNLHAATALHFVQGIFLGGGLALMISGLIAQRRGG